MDTSPIPGFITRKQAAFACQRAERTLQRYWSRAIEHRDAEVLEHLKLRSEDGHTIDGSEVTKDVIEELKHRRQNPTWYVHASWVEETYGPRADDGESPTSPHTTTASRPEPAAPAATRDTVMLLNEQLQKKDEEIKYLRGELSIKNEQIRDANERTRESNVLMRDLQKMLGDWQQQAFRSLPAPTGSIPSVNDGNEDAHVTHRGKNRREKGSRPAPVAVRSAKPPSAKRKPRGAQKKPTAQSQPTVFEKHTPTFHKALSRLLRR